MAANRFAGLLFIYAGGRQLDARGKFKINPGKTKREGVAGQDGVHGYKEMPVLPSIEGDLSLRANGITATELAEIENATITAAAANGTTYVLRNAWLATELSHDTEEGSVSVKFEGLDMDETR